PVRRPLLLFILMRAIMPRINPTKAPIPQGNTPPIPTTREATARPLNFAFGMGGGRGGGVKLFWGKALSSGKSERGFHSPVFSARTRVDALMRPAANHWRISSTG